MSGLETNLLDNYNLTILTMRGRTRFVSRLIWASRLTSPTIIGKGDKTRYGGRGRGGRTRGGGVCQALRVPLPDPRSVLIDY